MTESLDHHPGPAAGAPAQPADSPHLSPHQPSARGCLWATLGLLILVGGAVAAYFLWFTKPAAPPPRPRAMRIGAARVHRQDVNIELTGLGTVTALNTATIRTRVDGQIDAVYFKEGQFVHQGELLVQIDPRPFQVQLTQAQGTLARDQANLENAKVDLQRDLIARAAISAQQLATQQALVHQLQGTIKTDQGAIDSAKLNLDYSRITAPFDGRIGLRLVDPGNIVHASDTGGLAVITQVHPIALVFSLPEDNIPEIQRRLHAGATLTVDAYDRTLTHKLATGTLIAIDNQIDPTTGTVRLKAQFPNIDASLFPNQFVNAKLLLRVEPNVRVVPTAAVQHGPQGTFVYVVGPDDKVAIRPVTTGPTQDDVVAIEKGVEDSDVVVTDGVDRLTPGAKVVPQFPEAPATDNAAPAPAAPPARTAPHP